MQRHLTALQLNHFLGSHDKLSKEEKIDLARELIERHKHGLEFGVYSTCFRILMSLCDDLPSKRNIHLNPIAFRMVKTVGSFGRSECNRVQLSP